ncbi:dNTP triphosphohydrolase, broad substrate specificity, subgroup 2 [Clostridiaceae bacterium JG1575]|nr:dNTP triphosphohydrolase, broad substrate specificity, subgroup 2 [Clostridiaceae bacterium JG1575]
MTIRERIEAQEQEFLRPQAVHANAAGPRARHEEAEDFRTCFMVDRDRIIHCKSFRRLKHKTQVYIRTSGDHYRTRLTHTLEVSQIARTIARALALNEDLVEAITLGHDIGHVAFAHNGEEALNQLLPGGFRHCEQSVRVLTRLERDGRGLNLTPEVLEGVLNHSGFQTQKQQTTLEAQIARFSDKIAYVNHDIDDSIRARILREEDLPSEFVDVLGKSHSQRIDTLVRDVVDSTEKDLSQGLQQVTMSPRVGTALKGLRTFMFEQVYLGPAQRKARDQAMFIIQNLFEYYRNHPEALPSLYQEILKEEGLPRAVADYIAGMTDDFAREKFQELFIPGL